MSADLEVVYERIPAPIEIVTPGNRPAARMFRAVRVIVSGAYLATAGIVYVNLGSVAVPVALPAAAPGSTYTIDLYDGVMPVQVDQCELSQPLAGGAISVFLVAFE